MSEGLQCVPSQEVHWSAPGPLPRPRSQGRHDTAPDSAAKVLAEQGVHTAADVAPEAALKVPGGHSLGLLVRGGQ